MKAIESLPQARALYENVRRVTAQRTSVPTATVIYENLPIVNKEAYA